MITLTADERRVLQWLRHGLEFMGAPEAPLTIAGIALCDRLLAGAKPPPAPIDPGAIEWIEAGQAVRLLAKTIGDAGFIDPSDGERVKLQLDRAAHAMNAIAQALGLLGAVMR